MKKILNKGNLNNIKINLKNFNKKHKVKVFEFMIIVIITCIISFIAGYLFNNNDNYNEMTDENIIKFINNYNYIVDNYYENVDKEKLIDSAIAGMMDSLDDPYSVYLDSNELNNMNITLNGKYRGLGIALSNENDNIKVVSVFKNSPADKAGIKENDVIKKINDKSTDNMTISDFSSYVLNSNITDFKLIILRDNEEKSITIKKENITIDSVTSNIINKDDKKIGYIYISVFASNTASQFFKQLNELEKSKIDSLIIDVRNNTGGYLTTVEKILQKLLTTKQIVYQLKKGNGVKKIYGKASKNKDYEIVLLGNDLSASASEMLIAGLKENLNCKYIGEKTYGKGTVQELVDLNVDVQYKITTKKWLTPKGNWVNDTKGIIPDIEISLIEEENDNQLEKAIEYLMSKDN